MNLVLKLIFPTHDPTGSCGKGGRSGKSGKIGGKWGKIPVRYFYFLSRGFIFNSAGLKLSEMDLVLKPIFPTHRGGPTGSCGSGGRSGKSGKMRGKWGKTPVRDFYF